MYPTSIQSPKEKRRRQPECCFLKGREWGQPRPSGASNPSKGTWGLRRDSHREGGSGTCWGKPGERGGTGRFGVDLMGEGAYVRASA